LALFVRDTKSTNNAKPSLHSGADLKVKLMLDGRLRRKGKKMKRNIFEKILTKEDDFTNAFCNLLSNKVYRNILEETLDISEIHKEEVIQIESNTEKEERSKPDAIIKFTGDITLLLEVKISTWRGLTPNQPESYLEYLSKEKGKVVFILLIPIGYQHLDEFKNRYLNWENKNKKEIPLKIVYWQKIYQKIKIETDDMVLHNFADMLDLEHMEEVVSMNDNEIEFLENDFIYQYNKKIKDIIEYAVSGILKMGIKCENTKDDDGLNYYIYNKNNEIAFWFGNWNPISELGFQLVVGCHASHAYSEKFKKYQSINENYYIPFTRSQIMNKDNIGDSYLKFVAKYL
jgi:hypothetical protein